MSLMYVGTPNFRIFCPSDTQQQQQGTCQTSLRFTGQGEKILKIQTVEQKTTFTRVSFYRHLWLPLH